MLGVTGSIRGSEMLKVSCVHVLNCAFIMYVYHPIPRPLSGLIGILCMLLPRDVPSCAVCVSFVFDVCSVFV